MTETLNYENNNESLKSNETEKIENIQAIEKILNPDSPKEQEFLKEQTEICCKALNETFSKFFMDWKTKDWKRYDFMLALNKTVKNPIL